MCSLTSDGVKRQEIGARFPPTPKGMGFHLVNRMKTPKLQTEVDQNELYAILIAYFRQLNKLTIGPLDRLQSQEFARLTSLASRYKTKEDLEDREIFSAYMLHQWPLRLMEGLSLLKELPSRPSSILELASPGAPFSAAALIQGASDATIIDDRDLALRASNHMLGKLGYPLTVREADPRYPSSWPANGPWDLIILPYALDDLFPEMQKQLSYINTLLEKLTPQGHLLVVDESSKKKNTHFLTLRDHLVASGIHIQAPCLWQGACPALASGKTPCFTQRPLNKHFILNDIQKSLKENSNSLKMTYFLLCPKGQTPTHPKQKLYRVVSPPIDTFKGTRHFLCGTDGKKTLGTRLKEQPKSSRAYDFLKKGDVIEIEDALELGQDLVIQETTKLRLFAPFDKPVN